MSEIWGTLLTFLPLIVIIFLANLAQRARERSTGTPAPSAEVAGSIDAPSGAYAPSRYAPQSAETWQEVQRLPASLTDLPEDKPYEPYTPAPATGAPATPASPQSDGTIFAVLAYLLLGILYAIAAASGMMLLLIAGVSGSGAAELPAEFTEIFGAVDANLIGWGMLICSIIGVLVLLRPVRILLARFLPIDPFSTVHAVSLSFVMLVFLQTVLVMGIGLENMATMMIESTETTGESGAVSIFGAWFSALVMFVFGAMGVGWLVRRGGAETLGRLGVVMPTGGQVIVSILVGFLMVGVVFALEAVSVALGWGVDEAVSELTEQMLGGLMTTLPGVLTIGLAAGIGEEALMRGAVQPRLGLILTSVTFALLHANYGITFSTLAVLIVGLALGILRQRFNTTSAMITHATYNTILGLLAYFSLGAI